MTTATSPNLEAINYGRKLRQDTVACRLQHAKLGTRRSLTKNQIQHAAQTFSADSALLSASKRIIDTKHPAYARVQQIYRKATDYWRAMSLPYPELAVRLIRRDRVQEFNDRMTTMRGELTEAVAVLESSWVELRDEARQKLGDLFNQGDYPSSITSEFHLVWDYPNIDPPAYLRQIHPQLYEQECQRIQARFDEAVRLSEEAIAVQLHDLVAHLADRLAGKDDGKPKQIRDSALANFHEFFDRCKQINLGSNAQIDALVEQAKAALHGIEVGELRKSQILRDQLGQKLGQVKEALDGMLVERPRRFIQLEDQE